MWGKCGTMEFSKYEFRVITEEIFIMSEFYRMVYPEKVVRGYHCPPVQQPYWNTVFLNDFPEAELLNMIDHAYETVFHSFSKKVQKQMMEEIGK